mmetsp:Transcript_4870/g.5644  ORF Transcript_4870/g.5644 Transcript_4870/m.5644 type:complete len:202 (+) Transcript_4870:83-688(+)|eukprot:CAMPEP_0194130912 /NCGR_PEP_ID=MMETSP0152-20130528/1815_1 /TAXON_ID=1049557 /ORGANISM="Thalassiothrix antarctica, Strain L6-D1" /LENGTH=201 /DNA_ID=CAMNT_0038825549 /DNA_START=78 /DNA_END=683 /DNA_ORIENTATION=-
MTFCQNISNAFLLLLIVLTFIASEKGVAAGDFGFLRHRHLSQYLEKSPRAVADAIWSCVQSPTGEIEEKLMQIALDSGFARQTVRHLCRLARQKVEEDGSTEKLEEDLAKVKDLPVTPKEEPEKEEKKVHEGYKSKALWNMSFEQHQALSKAVLSAIRSPTKEIDPKAMSEAIATGVTKETVIASLNVSLGTSSSLPKKVE